MVFARVLMVRSLLNSLILVGLFLFSSLSFAGGKPKCSKLVEAIQTSSLVMATAIVENPKCYTQNPHFISEGHPATGISPLMHAAFYGNPHMIRLLAQSVGSNTMS